MNFKLISSNIIHISTHILMKDPHREWHLLLPHFQQHFLIYNFRFEVALRKATYAGFLKIPLIITYLIIHQILLNLSFKL